MKLLMEKTEKYFCAQEDYAEQMVSEFKNDQTDYVLVDWKISRKETKDGEYFIVVVKLRYKTLAEAKETV